MKNLTVVSIVLVLWVAANNLAADETLEFSGDWMFNAEKSDPPRRTVIGQAKDAGRGGMRADGRIAGGMGGGGTAGMGGARAGGMGGAGTTGAGGARAGGMSGGGTAGMGGARAGGMGGGGTAGMGGNAPGGMGGANPGMMGGQVPSIGMGTATFDAESLVAPDMPWTIELTGKRLRIMNTHAVNGNYIPNLESYLLDGKSHEERTPYVDGEIVKTTKASLKKNKIEIEVKVFDANGNRSITRKELELSKDGQSLTVKIAQELKYLLTSEKKVLERR